MIKKPATALPPWSEAQAEKALYVAGSLVWYQKDKDSAGYAYKAKTPYFETKQTPDVSNYWAIDYTFAAPWSENGIYKIGSRVYYFNGQASYVYIASSRYFGGSGKPNEEVDLDGIRTWELEVDYYKNNDTFGTYPNYPEFAEFLYPVRNHGGFTGNKVAPFSPISPEDRVDIYASAIGDYEPVAKYLKDNGVGKEDYSDINSVYQSFAYDEFTYNFYFDKLDSEGNKIHRSKGIHWATHIKNEALPSDKFKKSGDRQFLHVVGKGSLVQVGFWSYYNRHGFSIEMWPNATDSDYEFIPTHGLHDFLTPSLYNRTPLYTWPEYNPSIDINRVGVVTSFNASGFLMNGEIKDPNDYGIEATPFEECVFDAYFSYVSPSHGDRNAKIYAIKVDTVVSYKKDPIFDTDVDGNQIITGYYYTPEYLAPQTSVISESTDSKQDSYKSDTKLYFTRTSDNLPRVSFNKYKKSLTYTGITVCGWKID